MAAAGEGDGQGVVAGVRRPLAHWLMLFGLVVMWGSSFLFTKIALAAIAPSGVVLGRLLLGAVVICALLVVTARRPPASRRAWLFFLAMAVLGNALPFWLISWGQQGIDSGLAGILMAIMPLTTIVLAHFFVAGESLNAAKLQGFLLGFLGIVVLMGPDALLELAGTGTALVSQLAVLGGALCYAINSIVARRRPAEGDSLVAAGCVLAIAALVMLAPALATDAFMVPSLPAAALLAVAFLGLVSTAAATVVYFNLIAAAGPSFLALINYLIPIWAVIVGMLVLAERPEPRALLALLLILLGIALAETRGRKARRATAP